MGEVIDFSKHLAKKQREETRAWLQRQGVMPIPHGIPFMSDDIVPVLPSGDRPSDDE